MFFRHTESFTEILTMK